MRGATINDADLLLLAQSGDASGLGLLLERHRPRLYAAALQLLRNAADAEDAVQDACLLAVRNVREVREPESVVSWLHSVVRNVCLSRLRARRPGPPLDELPDGEAVEESAEEAVDRLALRDWVWTALGELPEAMRVTAMLRYFGAHRSYEEIAAILGVPVGTVKSRLSHVRTALADALLKTAGLAHDEARSTSRSQARFFAEALDELNRGRYELLAGAFARDVELSYPGAAATADGRGFLIEHVWAPQHEAGVTLRPTRVLASEGVTVIDGVFENPPDDPFHCPPATSIVCYWRDGRVHRSRQYYAARPRGGDGHG